MWMRGCTDPNNLLAYTMKGKKDEDGVVNKKSLNALIGRCPDFVNEPTMLQFVGKEELGIFVNRMPKCTLELAGEGIEYFWACAKGWYCRHP